MSSRGEKQIVASDNPYQSDHRTTIAQLPSPLPLIWSIVAVLATTILFGALGAGAGTALAVIAPGYYHSTFGPETDPFAMGLGLGLTQGVGAGAVIGVLLVALFYWYRSRGQAGAK